MPDKYNASRKRWKKAHPERVREMKKLNYERGAQHDTNSRRPWTEPECRRILDPKRPPDRVLAKELGRTVKAIQIKRHVLLERRQPD